MAGTNGIPGTSLDGQSLTLTYFVGSSAAGTLLASAPSSAGTYTVVASFPGSTNYAATSAQATFTISPAIPIVAVSEDPLFNGQPVQPTATVIGIHGQGGATLEGVAPTLTYYTGSNTSGSLLSGAPSTAGIYTVVAFFPGSADYASASASTTFAIDKATPTVRIMDKGGTYTGSAFAAMAAVAGVVNGVDNTPAGSLENVALFLDYVRLNSNGTTTDLGTAAPTTAGTYRVTASFPGSTDYTSAGASTTFTISRATPTLSWSPTTITYGQDLGENQLDAIANTVTVSNVPGMFAYSLAAGTVLASGTQTLTVTFTPADTTDYNSVTRTAQIVVNKDSTATAVSDTVSGSNVTFTATVTPNAPATSTPTGTIIFVDTTTGTTLGTVTLSAGTASLSTSALPTSSQTITATYNGDTNYNTSNGSVTVASSVVTSVYLLNTTSSGALTISGNASINVPGAIDVDSKSTTAVVASGNASITATSIQVVGGYVASGTGHFKPNPTTGAASVADPLAALAVPTASGSSQGAVSVSGNSSLTINPGLYTSINVSGNGTLTMTAGIYVIAGGGFNVSGNATVNGSAGVLIYNAGSTYPSAGGSFGAISFSGNGKVTLSAATSGTYSGIVLFQSRDNTQALNLSGNGLAGITGSVYAANAQLVLSGNADLADSIVVGTMNLSGNSVFNTLTSGGSDSGGDSGSGDSGGSGNSGEPASAVVFPNGLQTLAASGSSALISVQLMDANGTPTLAGSDGAVFSLGTTSATGAFFDLSGNPTSTVTFAPGQGIATFFYQDTTVGLPTITVAGTGFSAEQQVVVAGAPQTAIFATTPQTMTAGQSSRTISVQLLDQNGNPTVAGTGGVTLTLGSTSSAGTFFNAAGQAITSITIPVGAGSASFTYSDGAIGMPTLTATASSFAASQQETVTAGTTVYTPNQIRNAYGISSVPLDGTGQTIAIVDAYDDPAIFQSVDTFDQELGLSAAGATLYQQYGAASSFLTVINENGQASPLPGTDPSGAGTDNWEAEEALDVEWTHAIAPGAHIILVEAASQSLPDLMTAVAAAAAQPGVSVVSMSWGFAESASGLASAEAQYDRYFTTPAGHQGVTFVASTGDYGSAMPEYPAFSPNVVAVGGTSLSLNADGSYNSETGWGYYANQLGTFIGSGGGVSQYESEPAYQQGVQSTGGRTIPDVSFVADPATGAWIADLYNVPGSNPWEIAGGTSLSAPAWAGLIALVDQGRAAAGEQTLGSAGATETQTALYNLPQSDFNVIASGSNGDFTAQAGYNLVTGLGTPIANNLVTDLIAWSGSLNMSGNTVPAWQGSSSYQYNGSGDNGTVESIMAAMVFHVFDFESVGAADSAVLHSPASPDTVAAAPTPADGLQGTGVARPAAGVPNALASSPPSFQHETTASAAQTTSSVAWAAAPLFSGAAGLSGQSASLSVFSHGGPLVLDRWVESPLAGMNAGTIDPQRNGHAGTTPGLDGDDTVLIGGAGTDLVIGGSGQNLMVGGFGVDRGETSPSAAATLGEPGCVIARWSATGGISIVGDTSALLAEEAASRDGVLWSALTGRTSEAFADTADAVVLDQLFGSTGLDMAELLGDEEG